MIVSEGDVITMTATATSGTAGAALLENHTTGQSVTQTFNGNVLGSLCRTNAEWIIEDVSLLLSLNKIFGAAVKFMC